MRRPVARHAAASPKAWKHRWRPGHRRRHRPDQPVRPSFHYLQIFEKSGISSLLRLIFMPQQGSVKALFKEILSAACQNRQNRAEIVSILLSILQDGSADAGAIERSFAQLSSKAKQSGSTGKSPHLKRSESIAMSEMTAAEGSFRNAWRRSST